MRTSRMMIAGVLAPVAWLAGCSSDLQKSNALLAKENEELRAQLTERNAALADSQRTLHEKDSELARRGREDEQAPLAQVTGFEQIPNVTATYGAGEVTVAVPSDVLFASGKTDLKPAAKQSLNEVATVLNRSYGEHAIRIEGHTDTDPIRKSGFASNHHLGFERAYAVRQYLISQGVAAARMALASYGPDQPQATKPASRRVEIIVMANN